MNAQSRISSDALKELLIDRLDGLLRELGFGQPKSRTKTEWRYDGIVVVVCGRKRGLWLNTLDGGGGDIIDLIARVRFAGHRARDLTKDDAAELFAWARGFCGIGNDYQRDPAAEKRWAARRRQCQEAEVIASAQALVRASAEWDAIEPIEGTPGERYLRETRGIKGPLPACIRWEPGRREGEGAIVTKLSLLHDEAETVQTLHRTHLRTVKGKVLKRSGLPKTFSQGLPAKGAVAWLRRPTSKRRIVAVEGLENGLSVMMLSKGVGVVMVGCIGNMHGFRDVPAGDTCHDLGRR